MLDRKKEVITSKEKRIEIASDFYQIPIEDINYIPQHEYKTIEEYLTTRYDVVFQEFPPIYTEPLPGIIIRQQNIFFINYYYISVFLFFIYIVSLI